SAPDARADEFETPQKSVPSSPSRGGGGSSLFAEQESEPRRAAEELRGPFTSALRTIESLAEANGFSSLDLAAPATSCACASTGATSSASSSSMASPSDASLATTKAGSNTSPHELSAAKRPHSTAVPLQKLKREAATSVFKCALQPRDTFMQAVTGKAPNAHHRAQALPIRPHVHAHSSATQDSTDRGRLQNRIRSLEDARKQLAVDGECEDAVALISAQISTAKSSIITAKPIGAQLDGCRAALERAAKRQSKAEEAVQQALTDLDKSKADVEYYQLELARLERELASKPDAQPAAGVLNTDSVIQLTNGLLQLVNVLRDPMNQTIPMGTVADQLSNIVTSLSHTSNQRPQSDPYFMNTSENMDAGRPASSPEGCPRMRTKVVSTRINGKQPILKRMRIIGKQRLLNARRETAEL
ncbi:unnamed protein product, partial [Polarella glacialis]